MQEFHILNLGVGVQSTTLYLMAVKVDDALRAKGNIVNRNMDSEMFLHRSCLPLVQIEFKPKPKEDSQATIPFWRDCLGVCGV